MSNEFNRIALKQKQSLSLDGKIILAQQRIREWYDHWNGDVYVSFSGGKDSTVLLHLVRELYPDVPAVFVDTGLEYPEIRKFAMSQENVTVIRPEMRFDEVIKEYGYPIVSKEVARTVEYARTGSNWAIKRLQGLDPQGNQSEWKKRYIKWANLTGAPFKISDKCCNVMKKAPAKKYEKETGRKAFIGTMASESALRESQYLKTGCNGFNSKRPTSKPLSIWLEKDVLQYIRQYDISISPIYGDVVERDQLPGQIKLFTNQWDELITTGANRTGCMFCAFGCHLEKTPNRFQRMKETHPRQYDYCMRPVEEKGLGLREVLEYIRVEYE